jgi:predicted PurR-regulated permease PerM
VAIIGLTVLALVVFVVTYLGPRALRQAARFPTELPGVTKRLTDLPIIGHRLAAADAPQRLNDWIEQLPRTLGNDSQPLVNALDAVVNGVVLVVAALVMVVAFLLDGPEIVERLGRGLRPRARARFDRAVPLAQRVVGRYFVGSIVVALLAATVALATGLAMTIPLAPVAAAWIAMTNLIPQIGGFLGGSVFVTLGFLDSPRSGVVCLVVFLVWQQLENHIVSPLIVGEAVDLSPPTTLVAALVGASAFGVLGALLAIPLLGVAKAVLVSPSGAHADAGRKRRTGWRRRARRR